MKIVRRKKLGVYHKVCNECECVLEYTVKDMKPKLFDISDSYIECPKCHNRITV
jgi:hypothetical protein